MSDVVPIPIAIHDEKIERLSNGALNINEQPDLEVHESVADTKPWAATLTPVPDWSALENTRQSSQMKISQHRRTFWLVIALVVAVAAAVAASAIAATEARRGCPHPGATINPSPSATTVTVPIPTSGPFVSDCLTSAGQNYLSNNTGTAYTRMCNTWVSNSNWDDVGNSFAPTLDLCIASCDTYDYVNQSRPVSAVIWNRGGQFSSISGMCWCGGVSGHYFLNRTTLQDSALRVGTFNASSLSIVG